MLLIDALYVNNGGGKILLDILIGRVRSQNIEVMYLLDSRIADEYVAKGLENATYLRSSLIMRYFFYLKNKAKITSVLSFGNIPPTIKLDCPTYTYFHNVLYIENKFSPGLAPNLLFEFKKIVIQLLKKNTSKWVVQSNYIKTKLSHQWNINNNDIFVMPIFENSNERLFDKKQENLGNKFIKFLYISDGHLYKNHFRLLNAFCRYNVFNPQSSLTLTIGDNYISLKQEIVKLKKAGINIIDKGIISKKMVDIEYDKANILLYPSLYESFGLGLIEGAMHRLPIIAANLPYVYEAINPNAVFDPFSADSIYEQMVKSGNIINNSAEIVCKNHINDLIFEVSRHNN
jgi:glycosyltransferase involved in cell wall biosynthesis